VWQTVVNSTFVILLGICANVGLTFFKCPTIANTQTVGDNFDEAPFNENSKFKLEKLDRGLAYLPIFGNFEKSLKK